MDVVDAALVGLAPHILQDLLKGEGAAGMLEQVCQQPVLSRG